MATIAEPRIPLEQLQTIRTHSLELQRDRTDLAPADAKILALVGLQGWADAVKQGDAQSKDTFSEHWSHYARRAGDSLNVADVSPIVVLDKPRVQEKSKIRAKCARHLTTDFRNKLVDEFLAANPEPAEGDPPVVRCGIVCPGPGVVKNCRAEVQQRRITGETVKTTKKNDTSR